MDTIQCGAYEKGVCINSALDILRNYINFRKTVQVVATERMQGAQKDPHWRLRNECEINVLGF